MCLRKIIYCINLSVQVENNKCVNIKVNVQCNVHGALAPPIFKANQNFSPLKPTQNLFQPPNLHKAPVSPFNILLTRHLCTISSGSMLLISNSSQCEIGAILIGYNSLRHKSMFDLSYQELTYGYYIT